MNSEQIPTGEKEPARWERITGTLEDLTEMYKVHERYIYMTPEIQDKDIRIPSDKVLEEQYGYVKNENMAMLLRRGNRSIGYLVVRPRPIKEHGITLSIGALEIATTEIDLSVAGKLIEVLKSFASETKATYISWTIGPPRMGTFSEKIGAQEIGDSQYVLPIEQLDKRSIFQSIKTWREQIKSEPQSHEESDVDYD